MFSNVTTQVNSWFGGMMPAGKKEAEENEDTKNLVESKHSHEGEAESPVSQLSVKGSLGEKNDDDASTPTEGADSQSISSGPDTPVEDDDLIEGGFGGNIGAQVTDGAAKAAAGARNIGSFLFSGMKQAGKNITDAGTKIKKTVEDHSFMADFNKEQEAFIASKNSQGSRAADVPPWIGYQDEENLKQQILALSTESRNFVRSPPSGVEFAFNYDEMHGVAIATMNQDENLIKMRYELVPKTIKEDEFWRNYFYRVSLICQSSELSSLSQDSLPKQKSKDGDEASPRTSDIADPVGQTDVGSSSHVDSPDHEFVSDSYQASSKDLEDVRAGIKSLGVDKKQSDEDLERELAAELNEYEVVASDNKNPAEWENEIQQMLDEETEDLR